jgi:hypothetical protein
MNKITKIALAVLASFAISTASFAGELTVTGNAKATYAIESSDSVSGASSGGKGIGIANEFSLSANGELDNGYTWAYAQDIDGATVQDDAKMTVTTPYGTVGVFVSEGGISSKYAFSTAAYAPGSDYGYAGGSGAHSAAQTGAGFTYGEDIGAFNNFQYHLPSDMLMDGMTVKLAYAPNTGQNANASSNARGSLPSGANGKSAMQAQVTAKPIDGLDVSVSFYEKDFGTSTANDGVGGGKYQAGGAGVKYSTGPVSVGVGRFYVQPAVNDRMGKVRHYINNAVSLGVSANDNLSLSYMLEQSEASITEAQPTVGSGMKTAQTESEIQTLQAAYTMGGMTLSIAAKSAEDISYTKGKDVNEIVTAVVMAF